MKTEYGLSKMTSRKNPYAAKLKKSVTMRLSEDVFAILNLWLKKKAFHIKSLPIYIYEIALQITEKLILLGKQQLKPIFLA